MNKITTIILIFISLNSFSQTEFKLHLNSRNAKDTTLFDYYTKLSFNTLIDSTYTISGMINYERDNGINYHSYSGKLAIKYGNIEYYFDTEKNIEYISLDAFYPFTERLKIGYNLLHIDKTNHTAYMELNWKWLSAEIAGFEKLYRLKVKLNPEIPITNALKLGLETSWVYIDKQTKWNTGLTIKYEFKKATRRQLFYVI